MKTLKLILYSIILTLLCSGAYAYTLTFDDIPTGYALQDYGSQFDIHFDPFWAKDHTMSSWGLPHSGSNVMVSDDSSWSRFYFKNSSGFHQASSLGAYFSTDMDVVVRMDFYSYLGSSTSLQTVYIGASGESWNNRYIEVSPSSAFGEVRFHPVSSWSALSRFCIDDLTITPVPEPSSLAALGFGLVPMAATVRLRRRKG